jgi:hypothetical protein
VGVSTPIWDYRSAAFPRYARSERAYFVPQGTNLLSSTYAQSEWAYPFPYGITGPLASRGTPGRSERILSPRGRACRLPRTPSRSGRIEVPDGNWPGGTPGRRGRILSPGGTSLPSSTHVQSEWAYRGSGWELAWRYSRSEWAYFVPRGDELAVFYARPVGVGVSRFRMGIGLAVLPVGVGVFCPPGYELAVFLARPVGVGVSIPIWDYRSLASGGTPSRRERIDLLAGVPPARRWD